MPRKPKTDLQVVPPAATPAVQEPPKQTTAVAVVEAPVKLTKRNMARYQQKKYLENVPSLLDSFYPALVLKMNEGNTKALELGAKVLRLIKDDGISVVTNIVQNNQNESGPKFSFEKLVRDLEARDKSAQSNIIEVQPE